MRLAKETRKRDSQKSPHHSGSLPIVATPWHTPMPYPHGIPFFLGSLWLSFARHPNQLSPLLLLLLLRLLLILLLFVFGLPNLTI